MVTVLNIAWQNFLIDSVTDSPHLTIVRARSIFAIRANQNKIERSFSASAHIMTDLRYVLDPSHHDELVILRSVYRLHHAADSQLACDEDEGRHCK